jgi:hypothetical protein
LLERGGRQLVAAQAAGDFVTIEVAVGLGQHGQQHQRGEARTEFALELAGLRLGGGNRNVFLTLHATHLVVRLAVLSSSY